MAYKIIWTESASEDIAAIVRFIARHNPHAARKMGNAIFDGAQILVDFFEAGSVVRELMIPTGDKSLSGRIGSFTIAIVRPRPRRSFACGTVPAAIWKCLVN